MTRTITISPGNRKRGERQRARIARSKVIAAATLTVWLTTELVTFLLQAFVFGGYSVAQFIALAVPLACLRMLIKARPRPVGRWLDWPWPSLRSPPIT